MSPLILPALVVVWAVAVAVNPALEWRGLWAAARAPFSPEVRARRALGRYLASLPPRSGLTEREEWLKEANALPFAERGRSVALINRYVKGESEKAVLSARASRGQPAVDPSVVKALLRGEIPAKWPKLSV